MICLVPFCRRYSPTASSPRNSSHHTLLLLFHPLRSFLSLAHQQANNNSDLIWNSNSSISLVILRHCRLLPVDRTPPPLHSSLFPAVCHKRQYFFPFSFASFSRLRCPARPVTMSVVASRPESPAVPYTIPHDAPSYKEFGVSVQPVSSRTSSISSYKTNYTTSTTPTTAYSPSSPTSPTSSCRQFDSIGSITETIAPVQRRVPQEVYDVILNSLETLHKAPYQTGCTTCFQRDLHALSLTCRSWEKAVRPRL